MRDDPEKEALREYCQFLEHMRAQKVYTHPATDFVNYAENGEFRSGQKLQEASVSAVFTKLFMVGNLLTNRAYGNIEDCQAVNTEFLQRTRRKLQNRVLIWRTPFPSCSYPRGSDDKIRRFCRSAKNEWPLLRKGSER